jgi:glycerol-3-phosphate dehydrogenase
LPGGDLEQAGALVKSAAFEGFFNGICQTYPWLPAPLAKRYAHAYGSRIHRLLADAASLVDLGKELSPGLFEREAKYLCEVEWANSSEDILWRRTKLGLYAQAEHTIELADWLNRRTYAQDENN